MANYSNHLNDRLYRYSCKSEGKMITGTTWNASKENVIRDVKSNYIDAKKIIVVWLKPDTIEYKLVTEIYH